MQLDRYDRAILRQLQIDGRLSNQELADIIGLSPSPCLRRVRRLEEQGLIQSYHARLDARSLGLSLTIRRSFILEDLLEEVYGRRGRGRGRARPRIMI